ncbi:MAG: hypothetical protein A2Y82_03980 [Candidatus Buchananbacteria bacterium RBG_13_36_9]|uniref:Uncharacterized protein n=1 Tax=Candidatus Buchananbacteria bacterium RBG_13_36_9 TaxID=1797530 RepID=A0A1G1XQZ0_9BACT|nr:MAG: hypothetical protein A2Y82_03980 [Candidatus Buchananbacteria bacterium RBG_13_36_9]
MPKNNEKLTPLNVLDVVKNPQKYDDQTRAKAIEIIFNNANAYLNEIDEMEKEEIKKTAETSNVVALEEIRKRIKNI